MIIKEEIFTPTEEGIRKVNVKIIYLNHEKSQVLKSKLIIQNSLSIIQSKHEESNEIKNHINNLKIEDKRLENMIKIISDNVKKYTGYRVDLNHQMKLTASKNPTI